MNINLFKTAFGRTKRINEMCKIDIFIKNKKCIHIIKITDELSENILGIDFLQKHLLHFDQKTQQISFLKTPSRGLFATRNFTLQPFIIAPVQARTFQTINGQLNYIANIGVPKQPLISEPSTWVTFNKNKHCILELQNCAPHEVNIETGDMLGILNTETTTPIPQDDDSIATICDQIYERLPRRNLDKK
jgi:hypothetical protein